VGGGYPLSMVVHRGLPQELFTNAFNSIHRREILYSAYSRIPELCAFCQSAHSQLSSVFGLYIISSQGVQQGHPIGYLLFCNAVHPLLLS